MLVEPLALLSLASAAAAAVAVTAATGLKGWRSWLDLRRLEILGASGSAKRLPGSRIKLAELKERVRKLEAIAAGIDI